MEMFRRHGEGPKVAASLVHPACLSSHGGGQARRKMANETVHTLKNPGDHFEHNHGRGTKHLSERGNTGPQVVDALLLISCYCYTAIVIHRREGESHGHSMDHRPRSYGCAHYGLPA